MISPPVVVQPGSPNTNPCLRKVIGPFSLPRMLSPRPFGFLRTLAASACSLLLPLWVWGAEEKIDFRTQIEPVLDSACFKCHSARSKKPKGDILLDDLEAIRSRSRTKNLVFPRKPEKSLLYKVINLPAGAEDLMPPPDEGKPLSLQQIALIRTWLEQGADFGSWKSAKPKPKPLPATAGTVDISDQAAVAAHIDQLIESNLNRKGLKPNPAEADDLWCRRVYLDLVGRIPAFEEIDGFLKSKDPKKRVNLIDSVLGSRGHVSTMYNYWCDVLRARDQLAEDIQGAFYLDFIKQSIRSNTPYDAWVRQLISPEGNLWDSPAVGYYLRDFGNPFANVDNTAIAFLGTQIGCAQCHDHPYDQWSRKAYHQFAAWTSAIEAKRESPRYMKVSDSELDGIEEVLEKQTSHRTSSERKKLENELTMTNFESVKRSLKAKDPYQIFTLHNGEQVRAKLPSDYKYPDGVADAPISPVVLFGNQPSVAKQRPADTFAAWLTAPENPRFALNIANRMWTRVFGAPFAGSIDSLRDVEDCPIPELAQYLRDVMVASHFDLRQFQRILVQTRTYSRKAGTSLASNVPYDFQGPLMRRMSAEQIWDSLLTLAVQKLDSTISFNTPDYSGFVKAKPVTDPDKILEGVLLTSKAQAKEQLKEMHRHRPAERPAAYEPKPEFSSTELRRASELPQPTPEGHFLRVFGQSNREIADGAWRSGTVPQTLFMLNSTLFDVVVKKGTPLYQAINRDSGDAARLDAAYLAILGRLPNLDEKRLISSTLNGTGNIELIAHTLLGTRQFLFIQ